MIILKKLKDYNDYQKIKKNTSNVKGKLWEYHCDEHPNSRFIPIDHKRVPEDKAWWDDVKNREPIYYIDHIAEIHFDIRGDKFTSEDDPHDFRATFAFTGRLAPWHPSFASWFSGKNDLQELTAEAFVDNLKADFGFLAFCQTIIDENDISKIQHYFGEKISRPNVEDLLPEWLLLTSVKAKQFESIQTDNEKKGQKKLEELQKKSQQLSDYLIEKEQERQRYLKEHENEMIRLEGETNKAEAEKAKVDAQNDASTAKKRWEDIRRDRIDAWIKWIINWFKWIIKWIIKWIRNLYRYLVFGVLGGIIILLISEYLIPIRTQFILDLRNLDDSQVIEQIHSDVESKIATCKENMLRKSSQMGDNATLFKRLYMNYKTLRIHNAAFLGLYKQNDKVFSSDGNGFLLPEIFQEELQKELKGVFDKEHFSVESDKLGYSVTDGTFYLKKITYTIKAKEKALTRYLQVQLQITIRGKIDLETEDMLKSLGCKRDRDTANSEIFWFYYHDEEKAEALLEELGKHFDRVPNNPDVFKVRPFVYELTVSFAPKNNRETICRKLESEYHVTVYLESMASRKTLPFKITSELNEETLRQDLSKRLGVDSDQIEIERIQ